MNNRIAVIQSNAVGIDAVIGHIQRALVDNIGWLDLAFGRAQRVTSIVGGKRYITPSVYCGREGFYNEYIDVLPSDKLVNYCFFWTPDSATIDWSQGIQMDIQAPISIIFFFDLRKVFNENDCRNTEFVKLSLLEVLNGRNGLLLPQGRLRITKTFEEARNVYREFSIDEVDNQYAMHPYYCLRLDGTLQYTQDCTL